jgi:aminoglycoside phosphotransferase (APT) family kinase protein
MDNARPDSSIIESIATTALGGNISAIEPVLEGRSTYVYRLVRGAEAFYARVLPEAGASFAPEAAAHTMLRRQGVRVPDVVFWEELNSQVDRSVMITTAITGQAITESAAPHKLGEVLRAAGHDLALLNQLPVDGFGWIKRDIPADSALRADLPTESAFMLAELDSSLATLNSIALDMRQSDDAIRAAVATYAALLDTERSGLAHGDLDTTHICNDQGRYTGLIDLGDIRGTGPYYDLGHFHFHDGERLPAPLLPYLLEGYGEVSPLPPNADQRITLASLLIGVRFLARTHARLAERNRLHAIAAISRDVRFLTCQ